MFVAVIGAGASGLISSYFAALNGAKVTLYDKNEKCGKKIYITGKGRCNVANYADTDEVIKNIVSNPKFFLSSLNAFTPKDTIAFFEDAGLRLKKERGNRMFPASDKASDVTKTLETLCRLQGVDIRLNTNVDKICVKNGAASGIEIGGEFIPYDKVFVCTGGLSYPSTGSTGDGYKFAKELGHKIVTPIPALCGINIQGVECKQMQGLSLKNVNLSIEAGGKKIKEFFGELLFTHFGISGPIALAASSYMNRLDLSAVKLYLDFKPALSSEFLDKRILRDFSEGQNKDLQNVLKGLLPVSAIMPVIKKAGLDHSKKVNVITKAERYRLLTVIKKFDMIPLSFRGFEEAIITSGGVDVKEINPKTMESKIVKGLHFCGEVLDLDAMTGGFNLQIAFSTGRAAGMSVKV